MEDVPSDPMSEKQDATVEGQDDTDAVSGGLATNASRKRATEQRPSMQTPKRGKRTQRTGKYLTEKEQENFLERTETATAKSLTEEEQGLMEANWTTVLTKLESEKVKALSIIIDKKIKKEKRKRGDRKASLGEDDAGLETDMMLSLRGKRRRTQDPHRKDDHRHRATRKIRTRTEPEAIENVQEQESVFLSRRDERSSVDSVRDTQAAEHNILLAENDVAKAENDIIDLECSEGRKGTRIGIQSPERKKVKKSSLSRHVTNDVMAMAALLKNEVQRRYDPRENTHSVNPNCRSQADHLGREVKQGPFTKEENEILLAKIKNYFVQQGWFEEQGWDELRRRPTRDSRNKKIWCSIATCLPQRQVRCIRKHAQRVLVPHQKGPWTSDQEQDLVNLVQKYGPRWGFLSREYLHRCPDRLCSKYKELMPLLQRGGKLSEARRRASFTLKDDVKLLMTIRDITGVILPFRAIPWSQVQRELPHFAVNQLATRYKTTLFPKILGTYSKGATPLVVLRQLVRYVRRGIEAGVIHDLSEVEMRRIVPFWYATDHGRRLRTVIRMKCPEEVQKATFPEKIEYLYKLLKCDKKEKKDLILLARTFKTLQELNGVAVIGQQRRVLSDFYKEPRDLVPKLHKKAQSLTEVDTNNLNPSSSSSGNMEDSSILSFESRLFKGELARSASVQNSVDQIVGPVAKTFKDIGTAIDDIDWQSDEESCDSTTNHGPGSDAADKKRNERRNSLVSEKETPRIARRETDSNVFIPSPANARNSPKKFIRPMSASRKCIRKVVPPALYDVPQAFPLYLGLARQRQEKKKQVERFKESDADAIEYADRNKDESSTAKNQTATDYLDYHLYEGLGLIDHQRVDADREDEDGRHPIASSVDYLLKRNSIKGNPETESSITTVGGVEENRSKTSSPSTPSCEKDDNERDDNEKDDNEKDDNEKDDNEEAQKVKEFWKSVERISEFAEATDSEDEENVSSGEEELSAILNQEQTRKTVVIDGSRIRKKFHPWMS